MYRTKVESFEACVANMRRSANSLAMYLGGMSRYRNCMSTEAVVLTINRQGRKDALGGPL